MTVKIINFVLTTDQNVKCLYLLIRTVKSFKYIIHIHLHRIQNLHLILTGYFDVFLNYFQNF